MRGGDLRAPHSSPLLAGMRLSSLTIRQRNVPSSRQRPFKERTINETLEASNIVRRTRPPRRAEESRPSPASTKPGAGSATRLRSLPRPNRASLPQISPWRGAMLQLSFHALHQDAPTTLVRRRILLDRSAIPPELRDSFPPGDTRRPPRQPV